MRIAHVNVRSLTHNFVNFRGRVLERDLDIIAVSETWLTDAIEDEVVRIDGNGMVRRDRGDGRRGGGVAFYIRSPLCFQVIGDLPQMRSEQLWIRVRNQSKVYAVGVWYRGGDLPLNIFFEEFEECLSFLAPTCDTLICTGDFNINYLDIGGSNILKLNDILYSYNLSQVVTEPTRFGNLLDLFMITSGVDCVCSVVHTPDIADHDMVVCQVSQDRRIKGEKIITFRDFSNFDQDLFIEHLISTPFEDIFSLDSINDKVRVFNSYLMLLFDIHAPLKSVKVTKQRAPWVTATIKKMISLRDRALANYKRTSNNNHLTFYKTMRNQINRAVKTEKRVYLQSRVAPGGGTQNIWKKFQLLGINDNVRPEIPPNLKNVNTINNHFVNNFQTHSQADADLLNFFSTSKFNESISFDFEYVTKDTVYETLLTFDSNATGVDGICLKFLLSSCPHILPYVTHIINYCFETCTFPDLWKIATVTAVPKCNNPSTLNDLRPISILCLLSKLAEKIMNNQLKLYLDLHNILPANQSGFRKDFSCSTALLHVTDDILKATDEGKLTVLILLDFSKAFDRVNHELLLKILGYYGLSCEAVRFLKEYLTSRKQCVRVGDECSDLLNIISGVPQGAVPSTTFFSVYTSKLKDAFKNCCTHYYADDTQVYLSFDTKDIDSACMHINEDLRRLTELLKKYCLTLNASKSKVMLFGRKPDRKKFEQQINIFVSGEQLELVRVARNLGLELDTDFNFQAHVNKCVKKAFSNLKLIYAHKDYLTAINKRILCESLVLSHFNFADSVYGSHLTGVAQDRIQKIQNACIRLIGGIRKFDHISHLYLELKLLRMNERRFLHFCCLAHKVVQEKTPPYLYNKITYRTDVHNVNIRRKGLLTIPRHRTKLFQGSFSYRVCKVLNNLPSKVKILKNNNFKFTIKDMLINKKIDVV